MDEKLLQQILDCAEDVEIPESLLPENIEKKLKAKPASVAGKINKYAQVAAAVCILIAGGYVWEQNGRKNVSQEKMSVSMEAGSMQEEQLLDMDVYSSAYSEEADEIQEPENQTEIASKMMMSADAIPEMEMMESLNEESTDSFLQKIRLKLEEFFQDLCRMLGYSSGANVPRGVLHSKTRGLQ